MSITEDTWALIPGYTDRKNILDTLGLKRVNIGHSPFSATLTENTAAAHVQAKVQQLLASGQQIPDDIGRPVIDARRADELAVERARAMNHIAQNQGDLDALVRKGTVTAAFTYLRDQLDRILDEAVALHPDLEGAATAGEAIRTPGPAKAWKQLTALTQGYGETRGVQYELTRRVVKDETGADLTRDMFEAVGLYADALDVHPYWLDLRMANGGQTETNPDVGRYCDWMREQHGHRWEQTAVPELDLIRLATETTPWLPTPDEFTAARVAAESAVQRPLARFLERLEEARATYYAVTGATPIGELTVSTPITSTRNGIGSLTHGSRGMFV